MWPRGGSWKRGLESGWGEVGEGLAVFASKPLFERPHDGTLVSQAFITIRCQNPPRALAANISPASLQRCRGDFCGANLGEACQGFLEDGGQCATQE